MRQYCLPVMNRKVVSCKQASTRASYGEPLFLQNGPVYPITIDYSVPGGPDPRRLEYRVLSDNGTFVMVQSYMPQDTQTTVIAALGQYATVVSLLMGDKVTSDGPNGTASYTAACTMSDLTKEGSSTWRWTSLNLDNGVMKAHVTTEDCTADAYIARGNYSSTGFNNLPYAFEAAIRLLGGLDGYSKLINYDSFGTVFSKLSLDDALNYAADADMSLLESLLSQMLGIVHTSWTAVVPDSWTKSRHPVLQRKFPHHYQIKTFWTPATIIAIVVAGLVFLSTTWQAIRWFTATHKLRTTKRRWNLLDPEHLIDYTLMTDEGLRLDPYTDVEARRKRNATILPELERPEKVIQGVDLTTVSSPKVGTTEQKENLAVAVDDDVVSPASSTASS
jgi:hypothetical protein